MLAEDAGDLRQHARAVVDHDPQEVPLVRFDAREPGRRGVGREHARGAKRDRGPADDGVDDVGDHGRRGGHLPRPEAVEKHPADGVAHDADGVVGAAGLGEWRADLHERGGHPHRELAVAPAGDGHEPDAVAEFGRVVQQIEIDPLDAGAGNLGPRHPDAEGEVGEDREFLRRVGAVDVHRGIGLREALLLGELQHLGVVGAVFLHPREDEVARAVENAADALDAVGSQALADRGHDRDAAGDGRLERDRPALLSRQLEELGAVLGEQRLVGGDDVLSVFEQFDHHRPGRLEPADEQRRDRDRGIAGDVADVGRDLAARQLHAAGLRHVFHDRLLDDDPPPGVPLDMVRRLDEQAHDARPDGSHTDNTDSHWFRHRRCTWSTGGILDRNERSLNRKASLVARGRRGARP